MSFSITRSRALSSSEPQNAAGDGALGGGNAELVMRPDIRAVVDQDFDHWPLISLRGIGHRSRLIFWRTFVEADAFGGEFTNLSALES